MSLVWMVVVYLDSGNQFAAVGGDVVVADHGLEWWLYMYMRQLEWG